MANVLRRNRKNPDDAILRLNMVGFSLKEIGYRLNCHPTSISLRLKSLNVPSSDTRHSFMGAIIKDAPPNFVDQLADHLIQGNYPSVKEYVRDLIMRDMNVQKPTEVTETTQNMAA